jgi:RNA polymerase sigma-70 factor (ECF subfamily)
VANIRSIDETTLLAQCLQNVEWAQQQLYNKYSSELYPLCLRYAVDREEAKDMLQEGFIRIFKNLHQYENKGALIGWMKRVMVTTALNYIKKHHKKLVCELDTDKYDLWNAADTKHLLDAKDIMTAFALLPYQYRLVLSMYIIEGYSYTEISEALQIKESSCRTKVHRAKQMLQQLLEKNNEIKNTLVTT